jgi:hypothetical protein
VGAPTGPRAPAGAARALRLDVSFNLPAGCKLNKEAPITCRVRTKDSSEILAKDQIGRRHSATLNADGTQASVLIPAALTAGSRASLDVTLSFTYCRGGVSGLCKLGSGHWTVPIEVAAGGGESAIQLTAEVAGN